MGLTTAIQHGVGSLLRRFGGRPIEGRVYHPEPSLDSPMHLTDGMTFARLKTMLRAADSGDLATTLQIFEEMEEKDIHLQSVANTRRSGLTRLPWSIVSAAEAEDDVTDKQLADKAAAMVRERLSGLDVFDEGLEHMATGIGTNLAVLELVWERGELVDVVAIPSWRLTSEANHRQVIRVTIKEAPRGVVLGAGKFVVHSPSARAGYPLRCTVGHAQAVVYLIKLIGLADWAKYTTIFGMPVRWAQYKSGATREEKEEALDMLKHMSGAGYAMFSEALTLQLIESGQRGSSPHKDLIDWCERKQSIGWLGQHMTTDTSGATGTLATAKVQDNVRDDLRDDDIRREARTVRRQILAPMVAFMLPGRDAPLPHFVREPPEVVDRKIEAETVGAWQAAGLKVGLDWAYKRSGIPKPEEGEEVLEQTLDSFGQGLSEGFG